MELDFSWQGPAQRYQSLYTKALEMNDNGPL